jgi:hypothetical protein
MLHTSSSYPGSVLHTLVAMGLYYTTITRSGPQYWLLRAVIWILRKLNGY